jgi:hypothetical protein
LKRAELLKHTQCNLCGHKIGHTALPLFWRVTVERFGVDLQAMRRADGLASFIGSSAIAAVMGPDEDLARPVMEPVQLTVCEQCAVAPDALPIAAMAERLPQTEESAG